MPQRPLPIEHAELNLLGNREEYQDRVAVAVEGDSALNVREPAKVKVG